MRFGSQMKAWILIGVMTFITNISFSQDFHLDGKITDRQNKQPLAFVNVIINDGMAGGMSDINGKYSIRCQEPIRKAKFSYIGYTTVDTTVLQGSSKLNIALSPTSFKLNEVTVNAGENPAHRILDSVMAHRKENNPDNLGSYTYSMYDKMAFTVDSSTLVKRQDSLLEISDIKEFSKILEHNDLMVMETSSDVYFTAPDKKLQNVTGTKISGMKDPTFIYMVSQMQSISFYEDEVSVMGTKYVNPINPNYKKTYFFTLESVSPISCRDSIYVISFHPFKDSNFNGLKGSITINSDGWAVQSVKASPKEPGSMFIVNIQQLYDKTDGQWFPKQLNTNLVFPTIGISHESGFLPMAAIGKSYLTNIKVNPDVNKKIFSEVAVNVETDAAYRDEDFWASHRIDSLNGRTLATYAFLDSITDGNPILDRVFGLATELSEKSSLPIGKIDIDLSHIIRYSTYRGWFFGLGLSTNNRFSRIVNLNAYSGYWTNLKLVDYYAGINFNLYPKKQSKLSLYAFNISDVLGEFNMKEECSLIAQKDYKYEYFENVYTRKKGFSAELSSRFGRYFKGFASFEIANRHYLELPYTNNTEYPDANNFAIAEFRLRYAYKEKFVGSTNGLQSLGTTYPIVWLSYQHSFKGILDSPFSYDRFKLQIEKHFYTHYWGVSNILFQAGYVTEGAPIEETFDILASYTPIGLYAPGSFCTMRPEEFFCDRFAALFLSHNFSGMLWQPNLSWCKPELTLITNLGWGSMRPKENINYKFISMEKGYFESGFIVEGLVALPIMKLGAGAFYRYGPYSFDRVWNNIALKWSVIFSL